MMRRRKLPFNANAVNEEEEEEEERKFILS